MGTASFLRLAYEENPRAELTPAGTPGTGPNRVSTVTRDFPITAARLNANPTRLSRANEVRNILGSIADLPDTFAPDGSIAERCYVDDLIFLLGLAGYVGVHTLGLGTLATPGPHTTTVVGVNALNSATINVASTSGFPAVGSIIISGTLIAYTGKTATTFTGCGPHAATAGGETVTDVLPAATHAWVFSKQAGIVPQTAQMIAAYGNEGVWLQGSGFAGSEVSLNAAGELGVNLLGLYVASIADPAITPNIAAGSVPPIRRGDLTLSWLGGGSIAGDFTLAVANGLSAIYSMGAGGSYFPDTLEFGNEMVQVTGTIPKRRINPNDWASLISAATFAARAQWTSPKLIGATTYPYSIVVDMPSCQLTDGTPDDVTNDRQRGASYNWRAAWDETAGYDAKFTLVGSVAAVATYP